MFYIIQYSDVKKLAIAYFLINQDFTGDFKTLSVYSLS